MSDTLSRYPLTWPAHWPRAESRGRARFRSGGSSITVGAAVERIVLQMRRLGVPLGEWLVSTNIPTRIDGLPSGTSAVRVTDPGVAVYFRLFNRDQVLACDAWSSVADNLAAIAGHIEALRQIDRYQVGSLEQAFRGYQALPAAGGTWRSTLGFGPTEPVTREEVDTRFRLRARQAHPDLPGGSEEQMKVLTAARAAALLEIQS